MAYRVPKVRCLHRMKKFYVALGKAEEVTKTSSGRIALLLGSMGRPSPSNCLGSVRVEYECGETLPRPLGKVFGYRRNQPIFLGGKNS